MIIIWFGDTVYIWFGDTVYIWFGDTVYIYSTLQNVIQTQKCELCQLDKLTPHFFLKRALRLPPDTASSTRPKSASMSTVQPFTPGLQRMGLTFLEEY